MSISKIDEDIGTEIATLRAAFPGWVVETSELVERAQNAERAATANTPAVEEQSRALIVEVAEWQERLSNWQGQQVSPRLGAELRILKAGLDAMMDEANSAAAALNLFP
jgi:hypothetical protein